MAAATNLLHNDQCDIQNCSWEEVHPQTLPSQIINNASSTEWLKH